MRAEHGCMLLMLKGKEHIKPERRPTLRINFVSVANEQLASYRYHIQIPARELANLGHKVDISKFPVLDADVYVFSKHYNLGDYWSVRGLKTDDRKTVFHCCDNHFMDSHGDHYRRMIFNTDQTIVTTETMASMVKMETGFDATIIPDTYEFEEKAPSFNPKDRLKLLWYGNPTNFSDLLDIAPEIRDYSLGICTDNAILKDIHGDATTFPYSPDNLRKAFEWCDAVIIPSSMEKDKIVKSHNRLVEAVRQGKFVIANALPSYREFSDWMWVDGIQEGLAWVTTKPNREIEKRIQLAQTYIEQKYNASLIGELWQKALSV